MAYFSFSLCLKALDTIVRNGSLWSNIECEKEVISQYNIWIELATSAEVMNSRHLEAHNLCDKGVIFFHYYLRNFATNWAHIFTGMLFYAIYMLRYTKDENTGLLQLPKVSPVPLKQKHKKNWVEKSQGKCTQVPKV